MQVIQENLVHVYVFVGISLSSLTIGFDKVFVSDIGSNIFLFNSLDFVPKFSFVLEPDVSLIVD